MLRTIIKPTIVTLLFTALLVAPLLVGGLADSASALDSQKAACQGVGLTGGSCDGTAASDKVNGVVKGIVNILSVIVGIAAVIMIIIAGLKYTTAGGDSSKVSSAKSTLIYAIVGIVIVALAQFIVNFVLTNV